MENKTHFEIGDEVWLSKYGTSGKEIVCPDCGGTKTVKVVMASGTYEVDCQGCYPGGVMSPTGKVTIYEYQAQAEKRVVVGVRSESEYGKTKYSYTFAGGYWGDDEHTFANQEDALADAQLHLKEHEDDENSRIKAKFNHHKSYAWNASYHKKAAYQARQTMEYHLSKAKLCDVSSL